MGCGATKADIGSRGVFSKEYDIDMHSPYISSGGYDRHDYNRDEAYRSAAPDNNNPKRVGFGFRQANVVANSPSRGTRELGHAAGLARTSTEASVAQDYPMPVDMSDWQRIGDGSGLPYAQREYENASGQGAVARSRDAGGDAVAGWGDYYQYVAEASDRTRSGQCLQSLPSIVPDAELLLQEEKHKQFTLYTIGVLSSTQVTLPFADVTPEQPRREATALPAKTNPELLTRKETTSVTGFNRNTDKTIYNIAAHWPLSSPRDATLTKKTTYGLDGYLDMVRAPSQPTLHPESTAPDVIAAPPLLAPQYKAFHGSTPHTRDVPDSAKQPLLLKSSGDTATGACDVSTAVSLSALTASIDPSMGSCAQPQQTSLMQIMSTDFDEAKKPTPALEEAVRSAPAEGVPEPSSPVTFVAAASPPAPQGVTVPILTQTESKSPCVVVQPAGRISTLPVPPTGGILTSPKSDAAKHGAITASTSSAPAAAAVPLNPLPPLPMTTPNTPTQNQSHTAPAGPFGIAPAQYNTARMPALRAVVPPNSGAAAARTALNESLRPGTHAYRAEHARQYVANNQH